jgi:DNA-directed RNA polymerase specialized sigma24 family protein
VSSITPGRKRWAVTRDGFQHLLARLDPAPAVAGERFQALHSKLASYFTYERCMDPEHWADETLDRAAKRLAEGAAVDDIQAFIYGIGRFVAQEAHRQQQRTRDVLRTQPPPATPASESIFECLDKCLATLSKQNRSLIQRYYSGDGKSLIKQRQELAEELGISIESLRTRALRIRKDLESCVGACREEEGGIVMKPAFSPLKDEEPIK